ncbi:uncharacterized protein L969DRAFT_84311 [Mixia osmundae IAM 14324]|uniref:PCI domain-containing protein n=1 Tax=Mixia osmundae (strain CBS 9802 / IAM 14324 / JCM 22182 / KY 12970) TaxID=764103 RepID=G7E373_MIXOS|nr:uncharacterized protein L969DRAFT_84311 [Mixia osmundae IAM 14324]KEI42457.1 hypothetical protein L969DRAFT_84311 [Mixia osmundae IAM 14324]GAA97254.1 hypothetical protein E5Q_03931 [Mixia osmundae IAM 14324]
MEVDNDPAQYLATTISSSPSEVAQIYERFHLLYSKKLWFQLTKAIQAFIGRADSAEYQIDLYNSFIKDFQKHINQLRLAEICVRIAQQYKDAAKALDFLSGIVSLVNKPDSQEAFVLATMEAAQMKLILGDLQGTQEAMSSSEKILDTFNSVNPGVHASFYRVSGDYHKAKAEYAGYYKNSLLYLACITVETDLDAADRLQRAHDLAIAALLGDSIYNFGELLTHQILSALDAPDMVWLKQFLFAFNEGNIARFDALTPHLAKEEILQQNYGVLKQKICLMALIEAVFKRPAGDRILSFDIVARETHLPVQEVEHLVMKALSLKIVQGSIDQVSQTATITWVQPRVLDKAQIDGLRVRLTDWCGRVTAVGQVAAAASKDIVV